MRQQWHPPANHSNRGTVLRGCGWSEAPPLGSAAKPCAGNAEVHQREQAHPVNRVGPLDCSPDRIRTGATALRARCCRIP